VRRQDSSRYLALLIYAACLATSGAADGVGSTRSEIERIRLDRLKAVHEAREAFAKQRTEVPDGGLFQDVRAVLHVHAEDSDHTFGTRAEVLDAAKKADVRVVMFTDHNGPKPDTWHGLREGVLFLPGAETDGELHFPAGPGTNSPLRYLSHVEERPQADTTGFDGMEIYNRHADAKAHPALLERLQATTKNPSDWQAIVTAFTQYPDEFFAAATGPLPVYLSKWDAELRKRKLPGIAANDSHQNQRLQGVLFDPYEVSFRNVSTHLMVREFNEAGVREALREGRCYVAHDWLCDPTGFGFVAVNNLGTWTMGDTATTGLISGTTRLYGQAPVPAKWKLIHNGRVIQEDTALRFEFKASDSGAYRVEGWLNVDGEERPWIYSNPIFFQPMSLASFKAPPLVDPPGVTSQRNISFRKDGASDQVKQMLDVYWLTNRPPNLAPVFLFLHGGAWTIGDRSQYHAFGNRFAKVGLVTVIPSYRLAPDHVHPAQIEDVASAFAWTVRHASQYGGDTNRIFVGGHSAGGHLSALLALDESHLAAHGLSTKMIRGVIGLSGVYELRLSDIFTDVFSDDPAARRRASPQAHVRKTLFPFLITYAQFDYFSLPAQARLFHNALLRNGTKSRLFETRGENHISEAFAFLQDDDPTARAMIEFMKAP
jgi:acetyl esterase/lipase